MDQMSVAFRTATPGDIPVLSALFRKTINHVNIKDYTFDQIKAWEHKVNQQRWNELFESDLHFIIAESEGNELLGFTSISKDGYLHSMFVHYKYQRNGIGTLLLRRAEEFAMLNLAQIIRSEVSITARPFFEKSGYSIIKEQEVSLNGERLVNYVMLKRI